MSNEPLSPEILVPRLGNYLVERGDLHPAQLKQALQHQEAQRAQGVNHLIGQVLVELGIIDKATLDAAITEFVIELRAALQEANAQLLEANQHLERRVEERTSELRRALAKLSEMNQLKSNMVANISHELRTPLTHLRGYVEILLAGDLGELTEEQHNALSVIDRSSERLSRLIEDLILFSISERDQLSLRLTPVALEQLCQIAVQKSITKAAERSVHLLPVYDSSLPLVEGDAEKISWVILQLIDNAIKFTEPGGKVQVNVWQSGNAVHVIVQDTGIGIPEDQITAVFDSFRQLDGSSTRKAGGTGLGLALVKRIIEAHGAVMEVHSEVGVGSSFHFALDKYDPIHTGGLDASASSHSIDQTGF